MDEDTRDLARQLCTRAGMMMEDASLLAPGHTARAPIDSVLSKLVGVGLAQAHELELQLEAAAVASQQFVTVTR